MTPDKPRFDWLVQTGIVALAAVLRLGWPGVTEFKLDEARVFLLALELVELRTLPLIATDMSVGLPNAPLTVYLYALPMAVWRSPLAMSVFNGALNSGAVLLLYRLVRRFWGPAAALGAALLYATSPWAVLYSRKIWAPNLLPLFIVGYAYSGLLSFVELRRRWVAVHLLLLSVIIQIHVSSLVLAPASGALMIWRRRTIDWRWAGLGVLAAAATYAPFIWYLATEFDPARLSSGLSTQVPRATAEVVDLAIVVLQGTHTHALAGPQASQAFNSTLPDFAPIFTLGGGLVLLGVVLVGLRLVKGWRTGHMSISERAGGVTLLWLAMPLLLFAVHVSPIYPHYLTVWFSIAYALSGLGLVWLWEIRSVIWLRGLTLLAVLAISTAQVWQIVALIRFVGTSDTPGAFGTPVQHILTVIDYVRRQAQSDVVVVSEGADPWRDEMPTVFHALLYDIPHRFVDGRASTVLPGSDALVVVWPGERPLRGEAAYRQWAGGDWALVTPLRVGEGQVLIARGPERSLAAPRLRSASALLSNGAEVLGQGGDLANWQLWWRAPGPAPGEDYTVFAHLLDAGGGRVSQSDIPTYPGQYWREGDLVVSYLPLQGTGTTVRTGMYHSASQAPVDVLDAAGNPAGTWLEFPATDR